MHYGKHVLITTYCVLIFILFRKIKITVRILLVNKTIVENWPFPVRGKDQWLFQQFYSCLMSNLPLTLLIFIIILKIIVIIIALSHERLSNRSSENLAMHKIVDVKMNSLQGAIAAYTQLRVSSCIHPRCSAVGCFICLCL